MRARTSLKAPGRGRYTGGALEQIVNRRTDCQLSIVGAGGIPIVLI